MAPRRDNADLTKALRHAEDRARYWEERAGWLTKVICDYLTALDDRKAAIENMKEIRDH